MWTLLTNRRVLQAAAIMAVLLVVALWPEAVEVEVGQVTRGAMAMTLEGQGVTRVHHRYIVYAPVAGTLEPIELQPGNGVQLGQTILARLLPEPPPPLARAARREATEAIAAATRALEDARAEEARATEALDQATLDLKRAQDLFGDGSTTQQSLEARRSLVVSAQDGVNSARYDTAAAAATLERAQARVTPARLAPAGQALEILAPVDGVVLRRLWEGDGPVPAGEPLLEIGDPSHLEIVADLSPADAARVQPGMRVDVEHWGGDTPLPAVVERVEPTPVTKISSEGVEQQRVNVVIDFEDDRSAWTSMGDAFRVQARIAIWESDDVIRVPVAALVRDGAGWVAFRVQDGRARRVPVEVGHQTGTDAEVLKGLTAAQQIVLRPPAELLDGARVAVRQ